MKRVNHYEEIMSSRKITLEQWRSEALARFGADEMNWRFVCPVCGHIAAMSDWKAVGATSAHAAFSCVGRWIDGSRQAFGGKGPGPCDYAGGGLFGLNPVQVECLDGSVVAVFEFAEALK